MPARTLALVLAAVWLAVGSGCGAGPEREDARPGPTYTAAQVIEVFRAGAGVRLVRAPASQGDAWDVLGLGEDVPERLYERYGSFSIYVVDPGRERAVASLLRNKTTSEPLVRRDGVLWELDPLSGGWVAHKRFGRNVVLVWFSERDEPRLDARWQRLNTLLAELG